ncbi:hypothetical protein JB92DRAFT_1468260 [Gautieria morchelliformis]|nr:hypothetical protein JB92DRAFT_1468260 [Gautieria morchelliformis]
MTPKARWNRVGSCFAEGHDKIFEELNTSINRSQKGLLETLGSPAQATVLEEVKNSQGETNRKLAILEDKAELLQRQLHAISEQQGHILASLATITPLAPLLRDSPQQQTQILSMLASLPPMLPLLHSLQAQVKTSQEEGISLNKSIAEGGRSNTLPLPLLYTHTEPCAPVPLSSDTHSRPGQYVNCNFSRPDGMDERQHNPPVQEDFYDRRQSTPGLPSSRTLSSETEHPICLPSHSVRSHVRQPVLSASTSSGPLHNLALSTVSDPENSTLEMPPPLMPPSQNELLRHRKRPRLTSDVDIQNRDTAPHRIRDTVTPARTVSNKTLNVRSQSGTTGAKVINRKNSFRPAIPIVSREHSSTHLGPANISQAPDTFSPLPPTVPDRHLNATPQVFDRMSTSTPRLKRSMTTGRFRFTPDCFPPSTPNFMRRGVPPKMCTPQEVKAKNAVEQFSSRRYLNCDEHASPTGRLPQKQLRNSQQRKLLRDADDDVEIDLDWGDMVSN